MLNDVTGCFTSETVMILNKLIVIIVNSGLIMSIDNYWSSMAILDI